ncbi:MULTISPECIES: ParB/RepB/Spo0J family partition protein [Butyrivibrio]|uniref:Chromosome partitioning protein, ParB family n=1 Tax=Butyrivibrio fibrisolvens TaxID=831 RepID=A0A1H9VHV5_BUTFI|nr:MULTISPECIES: ParB/RepB/Spo0J family partition protein [Butyrivibrio]SES21121.1 chromosome partitioning protein, ParB family [Butyrivibrio fibrisolvens]
MAKKGLKRQTTESFTDLQNDVLGQYVASGAIDAKDINAVQDIAVDKFIEFKDHPFYVIDNEEMEELVASIKDNGVLVPVIARPRDGKFELIAGHRRCHAAKKAGIEKIPAIVKDYSDDEATLAMVDSNIQRENILPSEKAFAYRMKKETLSHQGRKAADPDEVGTDTRDKISDTDSGATVDRYIRLTYLNKDLLKLVDEKKLSLLSGVSISYMTKNQQKIVKKTMDDESLSPSAPQAEQMLKLAKAIKDDTKFELEILKLLRKKQAKRSYKMTSKEVSRYFPDDFDDEKIKSTIEELLTKWSKEKGYYKK